MPSDRKSDLAPKSPVWEKRTDNGYRFIFTTGNSKGWRIGNNKGLVDGSYYFKSNKYSLPLNEETWSKSTGKGEVKVKCIKSKFMLSLLPRCFISRNNSELVCIRLLPRSLVEAGRQHYIEPITLLSSILSSEPHRVRLVQRVNKYNTIFIVASSMQRIDI